MHVIDIYKVGARIKKKEGAFIYIYNYILFFSFIFLYKITY